MIEKWEKFQKETRAELQPILVLEGYTLVESGIIEDNDGFLFMFENENNRRIAIDVVEQITFEEGMLRKFNWLRVDIAGKYLKEFVDGALDTNVYLQQGWIWVNDEELDKCIAEIAEGFKTYFAAHPE